MGSEWKTAPLGGILTKIIDHRGLTPKKLGGDFCTQGIPVISAKNIQNKQLQINSDIRYITKEMYDRWMPDKLEPSDVLLTSEGPLGEVAYLRESNFCLGQRLFALRADSKVLVPRFLFYVLCSQPVRQRLNSRATGTTAQGIRQSELLKVEIELPPLPEQRAIANILGTLDDKIELNRRMNQTLEAMAQALFKNWFVDFEPFREQGMQDSPLGKIPVGWEIGTLGDIAHNPRRSVQPNQIENDTAYIGLEHMPRHCITLAEWGKARDIQSNKFEFKQGEILFGKLRPYFHKVGIAPVDGVCSTDILVIVPKEQRWFGIVLCYVFSDEFVKYTDTTSSGTKMPRTNWDDMVRYKIVLPPEDVVKIFNRRIKPFVERIIMNILESRTLASIRDTLLPRLLSGEIRIRDAESFIAGKNRPG